MNFISRIESAQVRVELKYCERCGGLFLRPQAAEVVYCGGCMAHLTATVAIPEGSKRARHSRARNPRMVKEPQPQKHGLHGAAQVEYLERVAALEVRA
jgi:hypothetical protein